MKVLYKSFNSRNVCELKMVFGQISPSGRKNGNNPADVSNTNNNSNSINNPAVEASSMETLFVQSFGPGAPNNDVERSTTTCDLCSSTFGSHAAVQTTDGYGCS